MVFWTFYVLGALSIGISFFGISKFSMYSASSNNDAVAIGFMFFLGVALIALAEVLDKLSF